MCVIVFSPKGVAPPSVEQVKKMWEHNPDGAGYAYVGRGGKVYYRKGFMKLDDLLKDLGDMKRFTHTNFAIHFRIGTSGENDAKTCHPFPLSTSFGDLRKTEGVSESVLFHNGVLSKGGITSPLASDTQDFVVAMTPLLAKYNRSKARDYFIRELTSGNRLLILYKNNAFKMFGDWQKDGDLWVSNLLYKDEYKWYGYGYYDWHTYFDDDYYNDKCLAMALEEDSKEVDKTINAVNIENEERLCEIWSELEKNQFIFLNGIGEVNLLKNNADYWTKEQMFIGEYVLGYDAKQFLVWVEESPIDYTDSKKGE